VLKRVVICKNSVQFHLNKVLKARGKLGFGQEFGTASSESDLSRDCKPFHSPSNGFGASRRRTILQLVYTGAPEIDVKRDRY